MPTTDSYTTPGSYTWTCPVGVTVVTVRCYGGGKDGVSGSGGTGGDGGGGGAFAQGTTIPVTPGNGYPVVVPTGNSGLDASFDTTSVVAKSATLRTGASGAAGTGDVKYSGGDGGVGGTGGSGGSTRGGGGGEGGSEDGIGGNGASGDAGGAGGNAFVNGGNGGNGGNGANGSNGVQAGGAGGGGANGFAFGTGAAGKVTITYTVSAATASPPFRRRTRFFRQGAR